ncbi:MAG TPA: flagellin [Terriglobales bacterium]|nr:flagellin [Terriglobales bacterium]
MALTILNNIAALAAENQLNITSNKLNSTLEQLSSGSRINSGADDPAGLAIANGLAANIAALTQSASNATDGVGELQVADGALSQVTTLLDRAVTLATESATGTVSDSQRTALDAEYQSIKSEIDSIGSTTNFNGGQVFTANTLNVFLSDGSASGSSTIGVSTGLLSSSDLNLGGAVSATGLLSQTAGAAAVAATDTLTGANFTQGAAATGTLTFTGNAAASDTVTVGTKTYTFVTTLSGAANEVLIGGSTAQSILNLEAAINAAPGGAGVAYGAGTVANTAAYASAVTGTTLTVTANLNGTGGNSIATSVTGGGNEAFGAADLAGGVAGATVSIGSQTYTFVSALSHTETANEVVSSSEATGLANLVSAVNGTGGAGYSANTVANSQVTAGASTGTTVLFTADTAGTSGNFITTATSGATKGTFSSVDFTGGTAAGSPPSAVAGDTVTIGTQTYQFVSSLGTPQANAVQVLVAPTEEGSLQNLANAINGGSGAGINYIYGSGVTANTAAKAVAGQNAQGLGTLSLTALTKGTVGNSIALATTGSGANTFSGAFLSGGTAGSINDLLTQDDAKAALALINDSVATVAALRGNIGATVNRLQSASNVITNQTQNLTAAENDVTAADIPTAVANLSQFSILEQTGISALAQANQQQQLILKLLQ